MPHIKRNSKAVCAFACLTYFVGCAGRAVDLDESRPVDMTSASGASGAFQALRLRESATYLRADDDRVFWNHVSSSQTARSCVYERCSATLIEYGVSLGPQTLADRDVYLQRPRDDGRYTNELFRCSKDGCDGGPTSVMRDSTFRRDWPVATDSQYFYWSSKFDIYRCPLPGCGETPDAVVNNEAASGALLVQGGDVFYSFVPEAYPGLATPEALYEAEIHSAPVDGSRPPVRIAQGMGVTESVDFAVDDQNVYWLDGAAHVLTCPRTGCVGQPRALVTTSAAKRELKVDSAGLYWLEAMHLSGNWLTSRVTGLELARVHFCPLTGCPPEASREVTGNADTYALTSEHVYWTNPELGSDGNWSSRVIFRTTKPHPDE